MVFFGSYLRLEQTTSNLLQPLKIEMGKGLSDLSFRLLITVLKKRDFAQYIELQFFIM